MCEACESSWHLAASRLDSRRLPAKFASRRDRTLPNGIGSTLTPLARHIRDIGFVFLVGGAFGTAGELGWAIMYGYLAAWPTALFTAAITFLGGYLLYASWRGRIRTLGLHNAERQEYAGPPDAPPEVRRWLAERMPSGLALSSLAEDFAGVETAAELETMTPTQIAARALQGLFGRVRGEIARTWLGVVDEGTDRAHAVYRVRFPSVPDDEGSVAIVSMRLTSTGWRVLWDGRGPFGLPGFGPHTYLVARAPRSTDSAA